MVAKIKKIILKAKAQSKVIKVSQNAYDDLLFIKAQLEPKMKRVLSFSDVVSKLVELWNKKYDRSKLVVRHGKKNKKTKKRK